MNHASAHRLPTVLIVLFSLFALFTLFSAAPLAQAFPSNAAKNHPASPDDWQGLLRQGETEKAEPICQALVDKEDLASRVEGYKCLANVALFRNKTPKATPEEGPAAMHQGWNKAGADQAIEYLEQAMKLAPKDLSLFQMRLFVLSRSGQMEKLPQALENSLTNYKGPEALDHWLSFSREFWEAQEFGLGLEYLDVLEQHFPNNPKVLGNLAAFAAQENKMEMALEYAHKAVELQPENPRFQWNLASLYERQGDYEKADAQFQKALPLFKNPETSDAAWCTYGMFVKEGLKEEARGQEIIKKHCKAAEQPQQ